MASRLLVVIFVLITAACSSQEAADFNLAQKEIKQQHYRIALNYLDRVILRKTDSKYPLEAAREAARISYFELKDYAKSANYHHFIVLNSDDQKERLESQKQIAGIYFNNLQNYKQAIIEFSKLQQMPHTDLEAAQYKLSIARAQYYLNDFFQADSEIDSLLKLKSDASIRFSALMLKGNILIGKKEYKEAAEILNRLILEFPDKSTEENVALVLAVCYEENYDFKNAIRVLEEHKSKYKPVEYIELRIKRLQERQKNAPGAKGFRK